MQFIHISSYGQERWYKNTQMFEKYITSGADLLPFPNICAFYKPESSGSASPKDYIAKHIQPESPESNGLQHYLSQTHLKTPPSNLLFWCMLELDSNNLICFSNGGGGTYIESEQPSSNVYIIHSKKTPAKSQPALRTPFFRFRSHFAPETSDASDKYVQFYLRSNLPIGKTVDEDSAEEKADDKDTNDTDNNSTDKPLVIC